MAFEGYHSSLADNCELCGTLIYFSQEFDYVSRRLKHGIEITIRVHKVCKEQMIKHERKKYRQRFFKQSEFDKLTWANRHNISET